MPYRYKTKPFQHQRDVLNRSWLMVFFGLLMEMGTGKTKIIIDNLAALFESNRTGEALVLAPKSVCLTWIDELADHMPKRIKYRADVWSAGMGKARTAKLQALADGAGSDDGCLRIIIMNTEGIYRDKAYEFARAYLKQAGNALMVVDESIDIKSHKAKRSVAARELGQLAGYRRILTGQPVPQGPLDLYAQCEFLQPGCLGYSTFTAFKAAYAITRLVDLGGRKKFDMVVGYRNIPDLRARLAPFVAIITKDECLDLPPKVYKRMEITLSAAQHKAYNEMREDSIAQLRDGSLCTAQEIMTRMLRLHQITCGYLPNDEGVMQPIDNDRMKVLINDYLPNVVGPTIIWTHFTHSVREITSEIAALYGEESVAAFYGKTKQADRQDIVRNFQNPKHRRLPKVGPSRTL